jgi:peptide/nickel transport system permease protein
VLARLYRRKSGLIGVAIIAIFAITAIFAPFIAPYHYSTQDRSVILKPPSPGHLLGTDDLGRDLFSRVVWGSRISFTVGIIAVGIGAAIGLTLGILAGYRGGLVDYLVIGLVDIVWSFPTILLAIALTAILNPGLKSAMLALGLVTWPGYARIIRAQFLSYKQKEFVEAARSLGASDLRIVFKHILPNAISPIVVYASMGMATAILVEASLSYLGLGAQPPQPSWGSILTAGKNFMYNAPLMSIAPGAAIAVVVLGFNLVGDALRDILDPRQEML